MSGQCDFALIGSLSCLSHVALSTAAYERGRTRMVIDRAFVKRPITSSSFQYSWARRPCFELTDHHFHTATSAAVWIIIHIPSKTSSAIHFPEPSSLPQTMDLVNNRGLNLILNFLLIVVVLLLLLILVKLMWPAPANQIMGWQRDEWGWLVGSTTVCRRLKPNQDNLPFSFFFLDH